MQRRMRSKANMFWHAIHYAGHQFPPFEYGAGEDNILPLERNLHGFKVDLTVHMAHSAP